MRLKVDENLPHELADVLASFGHDADSVYQERLTGSSDEALWDIVQREGRALVTRDLDFSDIREFPPGSHFGIVLVRASDVRRSSLVARVREAFHQHIGQDWHGCHVVIGDTMVRVRRPK